MNWQDLHEQIRPHLTPAKGTWPKNGEHRYFCVFHPDSKTPNLDINEEKGAFICRACGKAGKLTDLARHLNIPIERRATGDYRVNDANATWMLCKLGVNPQTQEHFSIKPDFKAQAWKYPIFDWQTNEFLGHRYKSYDAHAERKYWEDGGIGARVYFGRVEGPVTYLAEGEKDVWILAQAGLPSACITGTAITVPDDLREALEAQGVEEIRILYDLDSAGKKGARLVVETLGDQFTVKVLQLPKSLGKSGDVADLHRIKGDKFKGAIENLPVVSLTRRKYDENGIIGKVADKGFLRSYVDYCKDKTDAPHIFHLAVGLGVLGAALGNNALIPCFYGDLKLYPNLWVVLVAPTGFYRKSTALMMGKRLLRSAVPKALMPDDCTPQKLAVVLRDNPAGLMTISEFTRLLASFEREFMAGTKEMLTEMYDSPEEWVLERKSSKKVVIKDVSLSLLGATTIAWLEERVKARDLEGGFLARFLFIAGTERGPRPRRCGDVNHHIYLKLQEHLGAVAELEGRADYSLVEDDLRDWIYNYERLAEQGGMPPELVGMYARTGTTVQKLALLFQISMTSSSLKITPEAAEKAKTLLEYIHQQTAKVTRSFADNWFGRELEKVVRILGNNGGEITRQELMRATRLKSRQLDEVVKALHEQGRLEIKKMEASSGGGPRPTVYVLLG